MVSWRTEGVVQDSDNDEEEQELLEDDELHSDAISKTASTTPAEPNILIKGSSSAPQPVEQIAGTSSHPSLKRNSSQTLSLPSSKLPKRHILSDTADERGGTIHTILDDENDIDELHDAPVFRAIEIPFFAGQDQLLEKTYTNDSLDKGCSEPTRTTKQDHPTSQRRGHSPGAQSSDSPLSSLSSTPVGSPSFIERTRQPLVDASDPQLNIINHAYLFNRTFRPRNPIQLHPYQLESEQYKKSLRARGIKPVAFFNESQYQQGNGKESQENSASLDESQDRIYGHASSQASSDLLFASSSDEDEAPPLPLQDRHRPPYTSASKSADQLRRGKEFPTNGERGSADRKRLRLDLSPARRQTESPLRRKTTRSLSSSSSDLGLPSAAVFDEPRNKLMRRRRPKFRPPAMLDTLGPLTPSASSDKAQTDRYDFPPRVGLPTPPTASSDRMPTSTLKRLKTNIFIDDADDHDDIQSAVSRSGKRRNPVVLTSDSEGADVDGDVDAHDDNAYLRRLQKKIKGVLPASWLRLDKQSMGISTLRANKRAQKFDDNSENRRGVARRIQRKFGSNEHNIPSLSIAFADDDDSDESLAGNVQPAGNKEHDSDDEANVYRSDISGIAGRSDRPRARQQSIQRYAEALEDNSIDDVQSIPAMDASRSKDVKRTTQRRLTDTFDLLPRSPQKHKAPRHPRLLTQRKVAQSRLGLEEQSASRQRPAKAPARFKPPRLSIVDTTSEAGAIQFPDFVRLAIRRAREHRTLGRQSPKKKQISLHSRDEGIEVDRVVHRWRNGQLKQTKTPVAKQPRRRQGTLNVFQTSNLQSSRPRLKPTTPRASLPAGGPYSRENISHTSPVQMHSSNSLSLQEPSRQSNEYKSAAYVQQVGNRLASSPTKGQITLEESRFNPLKSVEKPSAVPSSLVRLSEKPHRVGQLEDDLSSHGILSASNLLHLNLLEPPSIQNADRFDETEISNPVLLRFLHDPDENTAAQPVESSNSLDDIKKATLKRVRPSKRKSKFKPRRLDLATFEPHQVARNFSPVDDVDTTVLQTDSTEDLGFLNLKEQGSGFSLDFGVSLVPSGLSFHQETFIGEGTFAQACYFLETGKAKYSRDSEISLEVDGETLSLGEWCDETSRSFAHMIENFERILNRITSSEPHKPGTNELQRTAKNLTSLITWLCNSFVVSATHDYDEAASTMYTHLCELEKLWEDCMHLKHHNTSLRQGLLHFGTVLSVVISLASRITRDDVQKHSQQASWNPLLQSSATTLMMTALDTEGSAKLSDLFSFPNVNHVAESGIKSSSVETEALVVVYHLARNTSMGLTFWGAVNHALQPRLDDQCRDFEVYESCWRTVFQLLPIQDFDAEGIHRKSAGRKYTEEDWTFVRQLSKQTLSLASLSRFSPNINAYVRAILSRVFTLVKSWAWCRAETVLSIIFDFFGKNEMSSLPGEEFTGSLACLESPSSLSSLTVSASDRSFHIFLKALACGLWRMREVYSLKKIKNIVWRFVPNHGRTLKKDEDLHEKDLEALRNQHDLLSILYMATPPEARISISLVRNLVDLSSSHAEVVKLSVKAWSSLVRFQLSSSDEAADGIKGFVEWFNDIILQLTQQHGFARTEAEHFLQRSISVEQFAISRQTMERTVSANQRLTESVIASCLSFLAGSFEYSQGIEAAKLLFNGVELDRILVVFDIGNRRYQSIYLAWLDVYQHFLDALDASNPLSSDSAIPTANEDSQDFGEDLLEEFEWPRSQSERQITPSMDEKRFGDCFRLLSNCIGSDSKPDARLLSQTIDVWTKVAAHEVRSHRSEWSRFLDPHSSYSWPGLRETSQKAVNEPYFLARIVKDDKRVLNSYKREIVGAWLVSLTASELNFKHQSLLSETLLEALADDQLLQKRPFTQRNNFGITTAALINNRMQLLTVIISNIRSVYDKTEQHTDQVSANTRSDCQYLLQRMMHGMKQAYLDTEPDTIEREVHVSFLHRLIDVFQQYTASFCPIDKFFLDPAIFPPPAHDPTYVVGRMRAYGLSIASTGTQKKLASFLQNACERAVMEGAQSDFARQVFMAVDEILESTDTGSAAIRSVLFEGIAPAYIEGVATHPTQWLLAVPILDALTQVTACLLQRIDLASKGHIELLQKLLLAILEPLCSELEGLVGLPWNKHRGRNILLRHATSFLRTARPVVQWIWSLNPREPLTIRLEETWSDCMAAVSRLIDPQAETYAAPLRQHDDPPRRMQDTLAFAQDSLQTALQRWDVSPPNADSIDGGIQCTVRTGGSARTVVVRTEREDERACREALRELRDHARRHEQRAGWASTVVFPVFP